jgi:hypothetical protein
MEPVWQQLLADGAEVNPRGKPGRFESRVSGRAFDMPTVDFFSGEVGRTLLEVVALPRVLELLDRLVAARLSLRLFGVQARTVIPAEELTGYSNWHRDGWNTDWARPRHRTVIVFVPMFDVSFETGPSAVVPFTHWLPEGPQSVCFFASKGERAFPEVTLCIVVYIYIIYISRNSLGNKYTQRAFLAVVIPEI